MTKFVFINPGHSRNCIPDPGATGNGYKEAELAFAIGSTLAIELQKYGIASKVYQQNDGSTSKAQLNKVPKVANESKADLFLSIHLNSGASTAAGTETLYLKGSVNGKKFAELINNELIKPIAGRAFKNRGPKEDIRNLLVLRSTAMPAALTEIGFISNKEEATFIAAHVNDIAKALCTAICKYFGISQEQTILKAHYQFVLEPVDDKYNCYVDNELKLKENKLSSCLTWINENYS